MFNILPFTLTIILSLATVGTTLSMVEKKDFFPTTFWDDIDEGIEKIGKEIEDPDTAHLLHEVTNMAPLQIAELLDDYVFNKHQYTILHMTEQEQTKDKQIEYLQTLKYELEFNKMPLVFSYYTTEKQSEAEEKILDYINTKKGLELTKEYPNFNLRSVITELWLRDPIKIRYACIMSFKNSEKPEPISRIQLEEKIITHKKSY